jgi:hypothetical protein
MAVFDFASLPEARLKGSLRRDFFWGVTNVRRPQIPVCILAVVPVHTLGYMHLPDRLPSCPRIGLFPECTSMLYTFQSAPSPRQTHAQAQTCPPQPLHSLSPTPITNVSSYASAAPRIESAGNADKKAPSPGRPSPTPPAAPPTTHAAPTTSSVRRSRS